MRMLKKVFLPLLLVAVLCLSSVQVFAADSSPAGKAFGDASLNKTLVTYDGNVRKPKVTLYSEDGTLLVKNVDYKVTYKDNQNVGTGKVVIKGIGAYAGCTKTLTFTIQKATPKVAIKKQSTLTIKQADAKKANKKVGTIQYYVYSNFTSIVHNVTSTITTANTKQIKIKDGAIYVLKGAAKGTYKVTVKIKGTGNVKAVTRTIKVVVK